MKTTLLTVLLLTSTAFGQSPIKISLPCESTAQEISHSGKYIAVRCKDHSSHVLEVSTGKTLRSFGADDDFGAFAYSLGDKLLAAANSNGGAAVIEINGSAAPKKWSVGKSGVDVLKFAAPDLLIVAPTKGTAAVWDVSATPAVKAKLETDFAGLTAADVSPDGKLLVTAGADTVVRFYDMASWKQLHEYRELLLEPFAAAFSADGKSVVVGGADGQLTILDAATGKKMKALPANAYAIFDIQTLASNKMCALYSDPDGKKPSYLLIWDLGSARSTPGPSFDKVTGGGVVDGKIWLATTEAKELEIRVGQ